MVHQKNPYISSGHSLLQSRFFHRHVTSILVGRSVAWRKIRCDFIFQILSSWDNEIAKVRSFKRQFWKQINQLLDVEMRTITIKTVKEYCRPKRKVISNQRVQKCSNTLAPVLEKGYSTISEARGWGVTLTGQVWIYFAWWQGKFQLHLLKLTLSKDEYLYLPDEVAQDSALQDTGDLPVKRTP